MKKEPSEHMDRSEWLALQAALSPEPPAGLTNEERERFLVYRKDVEEIIARGWIVDIPFG